MADVDVKRLNGVAVITPRKNLLGDRETEDLRKAVRDLLAEGNERLIINLGRLDFCNTLGLSSLIETKVSYVNRGGRMVLSNVGDKIKHPLIILKLINWFEIYEDEDKAVASFAAGQAPKS